MTKILYINLDRVPERRVFMEEQAARAGVLDHLERLSATDGRSDAVIEGYAPHSWGPRWELTRSETAVFDSHRRAWRAGLETAAPFVVMEDDALLSSRFREALDAVAAAAPADAIVKLDGVRKTGAYGPAREIGGGFALRAHLRITLSAASYFVMPEAARRLLAASESFCDHLDDFILNPVAAWEVLQLEPAVAVQGVLAAAETGAAADSERTYHAATNHPKARGPFLYRLAKEFRRSGRRIARAGWGDRVLITRGGHVGAVPLAEDLPPYRD